MHVQGNDFPKIFYKTVEDWEMKKHEKHCQQAVHTTWNHDGEDTDKMVNRRSSVNNYFVFVHCLFVIRKPYF